MQRHNRRKRKPLISLLVPFQSEDHDRIRVWHWLREYWEHELSYDCEIIIGVDYKSKRRRFRKPIPFSKTAAVNNAFKKSKGDIVVILDADAYFPGEVIRHCADRLRHAREVGVQTWFVPYAKLFRMTEAATLEVLGSRPGRPLRFSSPPPDEDVEATDGSGWANTFGALVQVMPREAFIAVGGMDCADEATEILTIEGWKTYDQVKCGDLVMTLNHLTGMSEWNPIDVLNIHSVIDQEMLSIESKTHSSLTTLNHRWPSVRRPYFREKRGWGSKESKRTWITSDNFTDEDLIPTAAKCISLPTEAKYVDDLVELVAWFWTEGSINKLRDGSLGRNIKISQSLKVNPLYCERIRATLYNLFGPESNSFPRRGSSTLADIPRWQTSSSRPSILGISLNAEAGEILQNLAPNRVPSYDFLLSLTKSQLELFIDVSVMADGHDRGTEIMLAQKNPAAADAFQFACILAGYPTSIRKQTSKKILSKYGYEMTGVRIRSQRTFKISKGSHKKIKYSGTVWCPTVQNETWLARRNGTVYFTGNSRFRGWGGEDASFMRALNTLWGQNKITPNDVLHLWHKKYVAGEWTDPKGKQWEVRAWGETDITRGNDNLSEAYHRATNNPEKMRKLVDRK